MLLCRKITFCYVTAAWRRDMPEQDKKNNNQFSMMGASPEVKISTEITLPKGVKYEQKIVPDRKFKYKFTPLGEKDYRGETMNGYDTLLSLDKNEQFLMKHAKNTMNLFLVFSTKNVANTPSEATKANRAIGTLMKKDLIRRIKKGTYMINPHLILPPVETQEETYTQWSSLKETEVLSPSQ